MLYSSKIAIVLLQFLDDVESIKNNSKIKINNINDIIRKFLSEIFTKCRIDLNILNNFPLGYDEILYILSINAFKIDNSSLDEKTITKAIEKPIFENIELKKYYDKKKRDKKEDSLFSNIINFRYTQVEGFKMINFDRTISDPMRYNDILMIIYNFVRSKSIIDKNNNVEINGAFAKQILDECAKQYVFNVNKDKKTPIARLKTIIKSIDPEILKKGNEKGLSISLGKYLSQSLDLNTSPHESFFMELLDWNPIIKLKKTKNNLHYLANIFILFWKLYNKSINKLYNNELILFVLSLKSNDDYKSLLHDISIYHEELSSEQNLISKFNFFINEFITKRDVKINTWKVVKQDLSQLKNYLLLTRFFSFDKKSISLSNFGFFKERIAFMMNHFEEEKLIDDKWFKEWKEKYCKMEEFINNVFLSDKDKLNSFKNDELGIILDKITQLEKNIDLIKECKIFNEELKIIEKIKTINQSRFDEKDWVNLFHLLDAIHYNIVYKEKRIRHIILISKKMASMSNEEQKKLISNYFKNKIIIGSWNKINSKLDNKYELYLDFENYKGMDSLNSSLSFGFLVFLLKYNITNKLFIYDKSTKQRYFLSRSSI